METLNDSKAVPHDIGSSHQCRDANISRPKQCGTHDMVLGLDNQIVSNQKCEGNQNKDCCVGKREFVNEKVLLKDQAFK